MTRPLVVLGAITFLECMWSPTVCAQQSSPGRIYEQSEVRAIPLGIRSPAFALPSGFRVDTVSDTVVITFVVDTTGRVDPTSIVVIRPGNPILRAALISRERQTEYSPGSIGLRRVPVRVRRQWPMPAFVRAPSVSLSTIRARVRAVAGSGPFAVPPLRHRYSRREYCEGDYCGCDYGTWEATATIPVYAAELDTVHKSFELHEQERFRAMPGYHDVLRPAVVIVIDTVRSFDQVLFPGDTVYLRQYIGELSYDVWYKSGIAHVKTFWAPERIQRPRGGLVQAGVEQWWVPIETAAGRSGWILIGDATSIRGPNRWCIPTGDSTIW